jgi:hypothetical protein
MAPITQCTCLAHGRYYTRRDAEDCIKYLSGTKLDDRIVRADWDAGFQEGRQYGRGKSGGQACGCIEGLRNTSDNNWSHGERLFMELLLGLQHVRLM